MRFARQHPNIRVVMSRAHVSTVCHFLVARSLHVNFLFLRWHAFLVLPMGSRSCVFSSSLGGEVQPSQHTESDSQHGREALLMLGETGRGMCLHVPLAALMVTQEALEAQGLRSCFFNPSFVSKEQFLQHILKSALDERDQSASALIFAAGGSGEFFLLNSRWLSPRSWGTAHCIWREKRLSA